VVVYELNENEMYSLGLTPKPIEKRLKQNHCLVEKLDKMKIESIKEIIT